MPLAADHDVVEAEYVDTVCVSRIGEFTYRGEYTYWSVSAFVLSAGEPGAVDGLDHLRAGVIEEGRPAAMAAAAGLFRTAMSPTRRIGN